MKKIKDCHTFVCKCTECCNHFIGCYFKGADDAENIREYHDSREYHDIICVPDMVISLTFNWAGYRVFHKIFSYLFEMNNLQELTLPAHCELFVPSKIAKLQKLKILEFAFCDRGCAKHPLCIKYDNKFKTEKGFRGYYIYKNKMLIFYASDSIIVPPNIKYLNIVQNQFCSDEHEKLINNLPLSIEYLNIVHYNTNTQIFKNLPCGLKEFNLTINSNSCSNINLESNEFISDIKVPFGCKLNISYYSW